ncbi:MAG: adenylosuccinate synthase, partial [Planctomycetota bacterium]
KGKIVDRLAPSFEAVVRYNGGANAGHTVVVGGERFALHLVPSGVLAAGVRSVIGNGVVVDPDQLLSELSGLADRGVDTSGVLVSDRAHVVMPYHTVEDLARERAAAESDGAIGTTGRGIGPAYAEKIQRTGAVRIGDLCRPDTLARRIEAAMAFKSAALERFCPEHTKELAIPSLVEKALAWGETLRPRMVDSGDLLHEIVGRGGPLLFEGANATLLDIDHGTFPYVTSSHPSVLGIGPGTGLPPGTVRRVIGVVKAYQTRVGAGPMPTELDNETGEHIRQKGREFGTTTGRPRRCGWLDLVALRYAVRLNGVTEIALMLLDVLDELPELRVCTSYRSPEGAATERFPPDSDRLSEIEPVYETMPGFGRSIAESRLPGDLPEPALRYVERIERFVGVPVSIVSVGPDRDQTVLRDAADGVLA